MQGKGKVVSLPMLDPRRQQTHARRPALSAQPVRRATHPGPTAERSVASARTRRGGSWGGDAPPTDTQPQKTPLPTGWEDRNSTLCALTQRVNSALGGVDSLLATCDVRQDVTTPDRRQNTAKKEKRKRKKARPDEDQDGASEHSEQHQAAVRRLCRTGSSYQQAREGHLEGQVQRQRNLFDMDMEMIGAQLKELKQLPFKTHNTLPPAAAEAVSSVNVLLRDWKASRSGVQQLPNAYIAAPPLPPRKFSLVATPPVIGLGDGGGGGGEVYGEEASILLTVLAGCILAPYAANAVYERRVALCEHQAVQELIRVLRTKLYIEQLVQVAACALVSGLNRYEYAEIRARQQRVLQSSEVAVAASVAVLSAACPRWVGLLQRQATPEVQTALREKDLVTTETTTTTTTTTVVAAVVAHPPQQQQHRRTFANGATRRSSGNTRRVARSDEDLRRPVRRGSASVAAGADTAATRSRTQDPSERRRIRQVKRTLRLERWEQAIQGMDIGTLKLYVASLNGHFGYVVGKRGAKGGAALRDEENAYFPLLFTDRNTTLHCSVSQWRTVLRSHMPRKRSCLCWRYVGSLLPLQVLVQGTKASKKPTE